MTTKAKGIVLLVSAFLSFFPVCSISLAIDYRNNEFMEIQDFTVLTDLYDVPLKPLFDLNNTNNVIEVKKTIEVSNVDQLSIGQVCLLPGKDYAFSGKVGVLADLPDVWTCDVTPFSGDACGTSIEASIYVGTMNDNSVEVSISPKNPKAGAAMGVNITAYSSVGLGNIPIYIERVVTGQRIVNTYQYFDNIFEFPNPLSHSTSITYTPPEPGLYCVKTTLVNSQQNQLQGTQREFYFMVGSSSIDKDRADFLKWMRSQGYSAEIIEMYRRHLLNPIIRMDVQDYFDFANNRNLRNEDGFWDIIKNHNMLTIELDEIIPTDANAVMSPLMLQHTNIVEEEFRNVLGMDNFEIVPGEEYRVNYQQEYGPIQLGGETFSFTNNQRYNSFRRNTFVPSYAHIVHYALRQLMYEGSLRTWRVDTGSCPVFTNLEFNEDSKAHKDNRNTLIHEWVHHTSGHHFMWPANSRNGQEHAYYEQHMWGADCIMNHTYVRYVDQDRIGNQNSDYERMLCPLCRYALSPNQGYQDAQEYAERYNDHMAGSWMMNEHLMSTEDHAFIQSYTDIKESITAIACGSYSRLGVDYMYEWHKNGSAQDTVSDAVPADVLQYRLISDPGMILQINNNEAAINADGNFSYTVRFPVYKLTMTKDIINTLKQPSIIVPFGKVTNRYYIDGGERVLVLLATNANGMTSVRRAVVKYKIELVPAAAAPKNIISSR